MPLDRDGLTFARLWRADYDWLMTIHWRYSEQDHTGPMLQPAAESRARALECLRFAGVPEDALELVFDLLGEEIP